MGYYRKNVRISSDEDDDTPKASPYSSPLRTHHASNHQASPHHLPGRSAAPQKGNNKAMFGINSTHPTRSGINTDALGHSTEYLNNRGLDGHGQATYKKVTFEGYRSPELNPEEDPRTYFSGRDSYPDDTARVHHHGQTRQQMDAASENGVKALWTNNAGFLRVDTRNQSHQQVDVDPSVDYYSARQPGTEPPPLLPQMQKDDNKIPMEKFLQHSRHVESHHDADDYDPNSNKPGPRSAYLVNRTPVEHNSQTDHSPVDRHRSYYSQFLRKEPHIYNNHSIQNQFPLKMSTSQDAIFQGSALDGSISGIDSSTVVSECTQSSVTSQYEAQFQLGLASLDTEIEKLQNSLKSMNGGNL